MKIDSCGEFGLIDRLKKCVTSPKDFVILGNGDDAAVFESKPGLLTVMTADALVEGVHFDLGFASFQDVGWRAMAANLSDVAATGGSPTFGTVCICVPPDCTVKSLEALFEGMDAVAAPLGCRIIGGDTTASLHGLTISIAMLGEVTRDRITARGGVKQGDLFCVTGHLGGSRAGLEVLRRGLSAESFNEVVRRYLRPVPRVREALVMGDSAPVHAAIDVSDGLASELHHLCRTSRVGARIEQSMIPIHPETASVARACDADGLGFALSGGEDFELLFTVAPRDADHVIQAVRSATGTPVTVVGEAVTAADGVRIRKPEGTWLPLADTGYDHFRN